MKTFYYIYIIICVLDLVMINNFPQARMVIKPLIVSSLLAWYIIRLPKQHSLIITGLTFAIIGDVLLLFESDLFFKLGLGAFLIMQLCYIGYLRQFKEKVLNNIQLLSIGFCILLFLGFATASIFYKVDEAILIMTYGLVLTIMAITAIRFPRLNKDLSIIGFGAILFVISDFTIAINKFFIPINHHSYIIMITYMAAQFLIIKGITDDAALYFKLKESQPKGKRKK